MTRAFANAEYYGYDFSFRNTYNYLSILRYFAFILLKFMKDEKFNLD